MIIMAVRVRESISRETKHGRASGKIIIKNFGNGHRVSKHGVFKNEIKKRLSKA